MLMVWTHGEEKLDEFIGYLNNIHSPTNSLVNAQQCLISLS